jgi:hypothetical protein
MDRMTLAGLAAAMRRPVYVVTLAAGLACPLPVMAQPMAQSPPAPTVTEPASPSVGHAIPIHGVGLVRLVHRLASAEQRKETMNGWRVLPPSGPRHARSA